jgi:hypothetical protein
VAWQRFRVELADVPEPIVVQTCARDFATVRMDGGEGLQAVGVMFQTVHNALRRTGAPVPLDYGEFLDQLEGMPEALDEEDVHALDPTSAARSGGQP